MTNVGVLDFVLLGILVVFIVLGARRGFVAELCGLAAIGIAVGGGWLAANTVAPMIGDALEPQLATVIQTEMENSITSAVNGVGDSIGEADPTGIWNYIESAGAYDALLQGIQEAASSNLESASQNMAADVMGRLEKVVIHPLVFVLSFLLILFLWSYVSLALGIVAKLPVIKSFNMLLGGVFGALKGGVMLWLVLLFLKWFSLIPDFWLANSHILTVFSGM